MCAQCSGVHFRALVQKISARKNRFTNAVHWIDLYPLDSAIGVPNIYMLDSDFFVDW